MPPPNLLHEFEDDDDNGSFGGGGANISSEFRLNAPQIDDINTGSDSGYNEGENDDTDIDEIDNIHDDDDDDDDNSSLSSTKLKENETLLALAMADPRKSYVPPPKESFLESSDRFKNNNNNNNNNNANINATTTTINHHNHIQQPPPKNVNNTININNNTVRRIPSKTPSQKDDNDKQQHHQSQLQNQQLHAAQQPQNQQQHTGNALFPAFSKTMCITLMIVIFLLLGGVIAIVSLMVSSTNKSNNDDDMYNNNNNNNNNGNSSPNSKITPSPTVSPGGKGSNTNNENENDNNNDNNDLIFDETYNILDESPTLKAIIERGYLICGTASRQPGFSFVTAQSAEGFDIDLCRAVAAALFEQTDFTTIDNYVDYVPLSTFERFSVLHGGTIDMLARGTTHTMERSIHEPSTGAGFTFSSTYIYEGLQFAGQPPYVYCADNFDDSKGICEDTVICVLDSSTHYSQILEVYPNASITATVDTLSLFRNFIDGFCNVVAGEGFGISESVGRELGYLGEYEYGTKVISKEPLAIVTRIDDPIWSDFVNWIVQAIIAAEEGRITSKTAATQMGQTNMFGYTFRNMFRNAVSVVGNYNEIYDRNLSPLLPRPEQDKINDGTTGTLFAYPYGALDNNGQDQYADYQETLLRIFTRGSLACGVIPQPLFAEYDSTSQTWSGFYVDFCKALSAALFNGEDNRVEYVPFNNGEGGNSNSEDNVFKKLLSGDIDVVSGITNTILYDVREPTTLMGFTMSQAIYHDGLSFGGSPEFVQCADELETNAIICRDMRICVDESSPFDVRLRELLPGTFIVSVPSAIDGFVDGECNVVAGTTFEISFDKIQNAGYNDDPSFYTIGINRFSKHPKVMATIHGDHQWSQFVYWIVNSIIAAEEQQITSDLADQMPIIPFFGINLNTMLRLAIAAVGSYEEIYNRNLEPEIPRANMNQVNELLKEPQFVPLPGTI